jgi:hypothetical protein
VSIEAEVLETIWTQNHVPAKLRLFLGKKYQDRIDFIGEKMTLVFLFWKFFCQPVLIFTVGPSIGSTTKCK